jgi:17beta-estradiol 17-dehydrogenase / very-long-chain 3-oxoacyl-CoA reductase
MEKQQNMLQYTADGFFTLLHVFGCIGIVLALYIIFKAFDFVLFHFAIPLRPLEKYRRPGHEPTYALITGGNGGIGYGIALALVQHGFGVILLGRNGAKLDAAAEQLRHAFVPSPLKEADSTARTASPRRDEYVKTIVLDPQTASPAEIRQQVQESIVKRGLRVSMLVNNVGSAPVAYPPYRELITYSPDDVDRTIDLNIRFMAHLTTQMLPVLAGEYEDITTSAKGTNRSLILNLSSGAIVGLPYQIIYASTKAFNSVFSVGLSRELEASRKLKHIDVLAILAGDVKSQGNTVGLNKGSPDSETYGRCIIERVDGAIKRGLREMTPFWLHHLNFVLLTMTPQWLVDKTLLNIMSMKMDLTNKATKFKD